MWLVVRNYLLPTCVLLYILLHLLSTLDVNCLAFYECEYDPFGILDFLCVYKFLLAWSHYTAFLGFRDVFLDFVDNNHVDGFSFVVVIVSHEVDVLADDVVYRSVG